MRLNKYLAKAGIASRREADNLIRMATTTVNGEIVLNPAYDVKQDDRFNLPDLLSNRRIQTSYSLRVTN